MRKKKTRRASVRRSPKRALSKASRSPKRKKTPQAAGKRGRRRRTGLRKDASRKRKKRRSTLPSSLRARRPKGAKAGNPPPTAAPSAAGVNLIGLIRAETGIGESGRLAARALQTTRIPFGILNCPVYGDYRNEDMTWAHKEIQGPAYNVNIFHINGNTMKHVVEHFGASLLHGRYNIGFWHWELPELPDFYAEGFQYLQEVWAPSAYVAANIAKRSPLPVIHIPHGIEVAYDAAMNRTYFGLPDNRFLFCSMYDTQSFQERKNPLAVIEAFKTAFDKDDPSAGLVVKVNNAGMIPDDIALLHRVTAGFPQIMIMDRTLARHEVNALIACTDSFVSLHRAEGFGLGLAEAMYLGKPVIGTHWSGNTDFMNPENSCTVGYKLVQVGTDLGPYGAHQVWADPDIGQAAGHMRKLVRDAKWRSRIAAAGQETIRSRYSPSAAGRLIEQRLAQLGLL
ncbi:glycosyltransferase family 4 protein [Paenibacillus elgii]|uniref:Glycosyl transferase family 1 n=1 Tax=Paenibacillus elgii TaxID=189691 RepID=A0A165QI46_9BACL|nr:glycosyltransferase family 4 protein [Paenibacillus elgii]KZE75094.1 glycosyl transferase family 1 [Paenibacillus elgii]NEN86073.1 glycosyltransferase family 4 protein [Paenibacillus elgii]